MNKPKYNPYKYAVLVLIITVAVLLAFSKDWTVPYYILTGGCIVFLGIKTTNLMNEDQSKLKWLGLFVVYTFIVSLTLGSIFYLAIPHFTDKYLFANIMTIEKNDATFQHTLIWNSPVKDYTLSRGEEYIYNNTGEPIYLISATYVPTRSRFPYGGGGIELKDKIQPKEIIKNSYDVYSYLEIPPDTITSKMRKYEYASFQTFYFIVNREQYFQLGGYETPEYDYSNY